MATRWTTVEFPALASFAETGTAAAAETRDKPAIDATATLRNQLGISKLLLTETLRSEAGPALVCCLPPLRRHLVRGCSACYRRPFARRGNPISDGVPSGEAEGCL